MTRKTARGGGSPEGHAELERRLGHKFANPELARQALTHRSFGTPHNERLEFPSFPRATCRGCAPRS